MKKLVILSLIAPAVLGLSACGGNVSNNSSEVVLNGDDANLTAMDDGNMVDANAVDANTTVANAN